MHVLWPINLVLYGIIGEDTTCIEELKKKKENQKQPKTSTEEWLNKVWYNYILGSPGDAVVRICLPVQETQEIRV